MSGRFLGITMHLGPSHPKSERVLRNINSPQHTKGTVFLPVNLALVAPNIFILGPSTVGKPSPPDPRRFFRKLRAHFRKV
ncbi:MAG: hypothetical protein JWP57_3989 [Spirosoma sp.]|nr:hypothetical protein [Spirosoma sp.]